jgi:aminodeoxyfutalosine deaminase
VTVRVVSAPWVLGGGNAIPDGAVALDGDAVVAVGPRAELEARHGKAEHLDAVILPALVNAHLHLELSHMAGRVTGGEGLPSWIQLFIAARVAGSSELAIEQAAIMGAEDLVRFGVAAVGDVSNTLGSLRPLGEAGLAGTVFHEIFGFTPQRFEAALAHAEEALAAAGAPPIGLRIARSPHAVYSTGAAALRALLRAGPGSIHLAEDPAERAFCSQAGGAFARMHYALGARFEELKVSGRSAVAAVAGELRPHHLAVHCVDLDDEDIAQLARTGATVVLCPRSNRYIVGRLPRLEALLAAGIPLAIGTDSLASSPSLSPLAELAVLRSAFPHVPAARLLALAWNGAAVGAPHVGRLATGVAPGVLAAPLGGVRVEEPFEWLVSVFGADERPFTWLARQTPLTPTLSPRSAGGEGDILR